MPWHAGSQELLQAREGHGLTNNQNAFLKRQRDTIVNYEVRANICDSVFGVIEFILIFLGSTLIYSYLVLLDSEVMSKIKLIVTMLILTRILLVMLASFAIYKGLKSELKKILITLGKDPNQVKTVP